jgi:hypothetical protein
MQKFNESSVNLHNPFFHLYELIQARLEARESPYKPKSGESNILLGLKLIWGILEKVKKYLEKLQKASKVVTF